MEKEKNGYYYEKKVTWKHNTNWWKFFGGWILSLAILINNIYLFSRIETIDWNGSLRFTEFLSLLFTILAGFSVFILTIALLINMKDAPKRIVKFRKIGK